MYSLYIYICTHTKQMCCVYIYIHIYIYIEYVQHRCASTFTAHLNDAYRETHEQNETHAIYWVFYFSLKECHI